MSSKKTLWLSPNPSKPSETSSKSFKRKFLCLKYLLFIYLLLVLIFEMMWTYFVVNYQLYQDLVSYHEDWNEVWLKEFYKSTKNFFLFIMILLVLSMAIGLAAVATENRSLLGAFIAIILTEWIFEFIGVYESKDRNVLIYRMIPSTLRPGIFVISYIFIQKLKKQENITYDLENALPPVTQHNNISNSSMINSRPHHHVVNHSAISNGNHVASPSTTTTASVASSVTVTNPLSLSSSIRIGINNNNIYRQNNNHHVSSIRINGAVVNGTPEGSDQMNGFQNQPQSSTTTKTSSSS